ncbi:MAG: methyltransferase domain-containing protein [Deltaproteobacteria bacterium]|nr:methyltransferase domain-containing protein [Deltaproteobacteria bacterium]
MNFRHNALFEENIYGHVKKVRLLRSSIQNYPSKNELIQLLDIGCGSGRSVSQFLLADEISYTGVDLHLASVEYADRHYSNRQSQFLCLNADRLIELNKKFDVIVLSDVLEHVSSPGVLLASVDKLLKPNGIVLVSVPNGFGPFEIESYFSKIPILGRISLKAIDLFIALVNKTILKNYWVAEDPTVPYNEDSPHIQFFTAGSFRKLIEGHHFRITKVHRLSFLSGPYSNYFFSPFSWIKKINCQIADILPQSFASAWVYELKKQKNVGLLRQ